MKKKDWLVYPYLWISVSFLSASSVLAQYSPKDLAEKDRKDTCLIGGGGPLRSFKSQDFSNAQCSAYDAGQLFISYAPDEIILCDAESVKMSAAMLFAERVAIDKLSQAIEGSFSHFDVYSEGKLQLPSFLTLQVSFSLSDESDVVSFLEHQVDRIASDGLTHEEVNFYRRKILPIFDDLLQSDMTEEQKYIYTIMEKEFLEAGSGVTFKEFLQISRDYLAHVHADEISYALYLYLSSSNRLLESFAPCDLQKSSEEDSLQSCEGETSEMRTDSFSGLLPKTSSERSTGFSSMKRGLSASGGSSYGTVDAFNQLPISEVDKKIIKKIITNMGEKNVFQLLLDKKDMEKMGKQIRHVHPMRFIGFILSDGALRRHLSSIYHNHFKWSGFMDGFKDRMKEEAKKGQLTPYIAGLAQLLGVDPSSFAGYIQRGDFEGLVKHFI